MEIRDVPDAPAGNGPYGRCMARMHLQVDVDQVDPIAGRLQCGRVVVDFTGWLDFLRVVSDVIGADERPG